jgi:hypothetical protein
MLKIIVPFSILAALALTGIPGAQAKEGGGSESVYLGPASGAHEVGPLRVCLSDAGGTCGAGESHLHVSNPTNRVVAWWSETLGPKNAKRQALRPKKSVTVALPKGGTTTLDLWVR